MKYKESEIIKSTPVAKYCDVAENGEIYITIDLKIGEEVLEIDKPIYITEIIKSQPLGVGGWNDEMAQKAIKHLEDALGNMKKTYEKYKD